MEVPCAARKARRFSVSRAPNSDRPDAKTVGRSGLRVRVRLRVCVCVCVCVRDIACALVWLLFPAEFEFDGMLALVTTHKHPHSCTTAQLTTFRLPRTICMQAETDRTQAHERVSLGSARVL